MTECDEIRRWCAAHSLPVTIYWNELITPAEHLIGTRCSHLSPLRAGMEEFVLFVLLCLKESDAKLRSHLSHLRFLSTSICLCLSLFNCFVVSHGVCDARRTLYLKPRRENTITFIASCLFFFLCTFFNSCVTLPRGALKLSGFVSCLSVYKEEIINQESGFCACVRLSLYVWRVWTWKRRTKESGEDARTRFTLFWFMHFSNFPKFVATNKIKVEGEEMASKDKDHSCTFSSKIMWKHLILSN